MCHGLCLNKLLGKESGGKAGNARKFHPKPNPVSSLNSNLDLTKGPPPPTTAQGLQAA